MKKTGNLNVCPVCNNRCIFCYEQPKRPLYPFPSFDEVKKIIDDFKENQVDHIMFLGGEPLLRKDVFDIVRYGTGIGIRFGMTTNGQLLGNRETVMKLIESGLCDFEISIHSADEDGFHLLNRAKKGNWRNVIAALDLLNEILPLYEGRQVVINTVVMDRNRDFLGKIPELLDSHFSNLKPPWMLKNIQAFPCTETSRSDSAPRRLTIKETRE
ncbi:MAG: radical SAM protein, partial [Deltaproteobacteria bacterium]|nr:radical SAM protein [Deltaproteobacteria bacterium]